MIQQHRSSDTTQILSGYLLALILAQIVWNTILSRNNTWMDMGARRNVTQSRKRMTCCATSGVSMLLHAVILYRCKQKVWFCLHEFPSVVLRSGTQATWPVAQFLLAKIKMHRSLVRSGCTVEYTSIQKLLIWWCLLASRDSCRIIVLLCTKYSTLYVAASLDLVY